MSEALYHGDEPGLRSVLAPNPGPFTLQGTLTYIVGRRHVAVVDAGPDHAEHARAVARAVGEAESAVVLLTHGHADHAGAAGALAELLGAPVLGAGPVDRTLRDGESVATDAGPLVALSTPGHTPDHLVFHWPDRRALFAGDLVLGEGDTTWVAGYSGCVADYLASLSRLETLSLRRVYPAHGAAIDDVAERIGRYRAHRRARIGQVEAVLRDAPGATRREILARIYGDIIPAALASAALASVDAILDHLGERERT